MLLAIRISGLVDMNGSESELLSRLRLRRKYSAILIKPTEENLKIIKKIRNFVAYGPIDNETLKELIIKRGQPINPNKKIDYDKLIEGLNKKSLADFGLKPFFRLHPPRGGIDSKIHFGRKKGVLGNNKENINILVRRML